ncbi:uncharacterized protein [Pagrus major]|uniref:uncharacterized protein isoform X1 n=1 Tax=Pagrus major TaxID=143350 RepID=UPI003CC88490
MVHWQLCTLEHLMSSWFGRPFPRHGLQLLFWFAKHCVTCELVNCVVTMKLVSDCQPEKGVYGFHLFGNIEELLPVLDRPRRRQSKRQLAYYEVGNLNAETFPAAANLPTYVRDNYEMNGYRGDYNIDRIIISYHVRTRTVETVYVTEHDGEAFGRFSPDRTHEISFELIQVLQSLQLDLTTFLEEMGYYSDFQVVQGNNIEETHYSEDSYQQMFNTLETYSRSMARTMQSDFQSFSEAFDQQPGVNIMPFSYEQQVHYTVNKTSRPATNYSDRSLKSFKRARAVRQSYWEPQQIYKAKVKKSDGGGGFSFIKVLLCAGALYLAAKYCSRLRSSWTVDLKENILKMIPRRTPSYCHTHIMLDYVF